MRTKFATKVLIWLLVTVMTVPTGLIAQDNGQPAGNGTDYIYSQEDLDQLLAPIALYPDSLLSQILMASTYPLEVVEADRWLRNNPHLIGDSLNEALKDKLWDASVKSLCHFPRVLSEMSENLQETSSLGDAFLSQQEQVMDTIQALREKARTHGNLRSTEQQKVIEREREIIIEPASPEIVHVPVYDPCWVYGPWWYPACSPLWFWYPGLVVTGAFLFGPPVFIGHFGLWSGFFWRRHVVFVDVHKTLVFHKVGPTRMHGQRETWRHDPRHRRGLAYRNRNVRQRFGRSGRPGVDARRDFRGFRPEARPPARREPERRDVQPRRPAIQRPPVRTPEARPQRPAEVQRPARPPVRRELERRDVRPPRPEVQRPPAERPGVRGGRLERPRAGGEIYQDLGRGHEVRQQSDRGWRSRDPKRGAGVPSKVKPAKPSKPSGGGRRVR